MLFFEKKCFTRTNFTNWFFRISCHTINICIKMQNQATIFFLQRATIYISCFSSRPFRSNFCAGTSYSCTTFVYICDNVTSIVFTSFTIIGIRTIYICFSEQNLELILYKKSSVFSTYEIYRILVEKTH